MPCQHTVSTYYIFQLQNEIILADTEANDDPSNEVCPSPFTTFELKNDLCILTLLFSSDKNIHKLLKSLKHFFFFDGQAVNRLIAITSELEQWQEMEPKCKLLSSVLCAISI